MFESILAINMYKLDMTFGSDRFKDHQGPKLVEHLCKQTQHRQWLNSLKHH